MSELSLLKINDMANNAGFALEYLLHRNPRAKELMKDGIELCSMIERGYQLKDIINGSELELWEFMEVMKRFFKPEELSKIAKEAIEIKLKLSYAINKAVYFEDSFSLKEIHEMQRFFNHVGEPFLKVELSKFRRLHG